MNVAPDKHGGPFVLSVNGKPIYVRGANWIPDDAFVTRLNRSTYATASSDALDAGMNLLRVWGGGIYETDDFYDICDELGVLVWQDFLFACAAYSEDEPLWSEVEAEAQRGRHPAEQARQPRGLERQQREHLGVRRVGLARAAGRAHAGVRATTSTCCRRSSPSSTRGRRTRPGSPYSYDHFIHPNDERNGTMHIWDVWNQVDYSTYRKYKPRFVSEFGFQGPPAWSTLTSVVHDEPLDPYGEQMLVHQKAFEGNLKLERGLGDHLPDCGSRWTTGTGRRSSTRPGRSPTASSTSAACSR